MGTVEAVGAGARRFAVGERIGVAWLGGTDGRCRFCRRGDENLCLHPTFTGWDVDGGYAEACLAAEEYAYRLPDDLDDEQAAPMLCSGIIGYRALRAADVPPGGSLGIYGFGASAHPDAQLALREGMRVRPHPRRGQPSSSPSRSAWTPSAPPRCRPPELLDGAVLFAPAGDLVPVALRELDRGGTLAVAGIWLSQIPPLDYDRELFREHRLRSVTREHPPGWAAVPGSRRPTSPSRDGRSLSPGSGPTLP